MIDLQTVKEIDGVLVIYDERSTYNGLSVTDYRELASKWELGNAFIVEKPIAMTIVGRIILTTKSQS